MNTKCSPHIPSSVSDEDRKPHLCILMNAADNSSFLKRCVVYLGQWVLCFYDEAVKMITFTKTG